MRPRRGPTNSGTVPDPSTSPSIFQNRYIPALAVPAAISKAALPLPRNVHVAGKGLLLGDREAAHVRPTKNVSYKTTSTIHEREKNACRPERHKRERVVAEGDAQTKSHISPRRLLCRTKPLSHGSEHHLQLRHRGDTDTGM